MAGQEPTKRRDHPEVLAYIDALEPAQRKHVVAMRSLAQALDDDVVECLAWGVPYWFRRGPLCYASAAREHVTLGIARGVEVRDRFGLLSGSGKSSVRSFAVGLDEPFPTAAVMEWLTQVVGLDERDA